MEIQSVAISLKQRFWFKPAIYALFVIQFALPESWFDVALHYIVDRGLVATV